MISFIKNLIRKEIISNRSSFDKNIITKKIINNTELKYFIKNFGNRNKDKIFYVILEIFFHGKI